MANAYTCIMLLRYKLFLHWAIRITWTEETCEQLPSPAVAVTRKGDNSEQMSYQYDSFELIKWMSNDFFIEWSIFIFN